MIKNNALMAGISGFLFLVIIVSAGCSRLPQPSDEPELPVFTEFSVTFPQSIINTHEGVDLAKTHIDIENLIFDMMNTIIGSAEGPTRSGFSWIWIAHVEEADYTITAQLGGNTYDWTISINGTNEFGYYENAEGINGVSNFDQSYYEFNLYDPNSIEAGPAAKAEYSYNGSDIHSIAKVYGFELLGTPLHTKFDIRQNLSGTGHVFGYWDEAHVWPENSKYLELYFWDASAGTAEHGSWQTWERPELGVSPAAGSW